MKLTVEILLVFIICLIGEWIAAILPFAMPSSVISMALLFLCLAVKLISVNHIRKFSGFLLSNMGFFFIPAGVGLLESFSEFSESLIALMLVCIVNTILTFCVTAFSVTGIIRLQQKLRKEK